MKAPSFLQKLGYPVEDPKPGPEALYGTVWLASRAQRQVARTLRPFGLTPAKFNYLMIVKHVGGTEGLSQREIAKRLLLDAGNVTHYLDNLEQQGWVVRAPGPDRRSHRIKITAKGDHLLDKAWPAYRDAVKRLTGGLPEVAQRRLVGLLSQWRDTLEVGP